MSKATFSPSDQVHASCASLSVLPPAPAQWAGNVTDLTLRIGCRTRSRSLMAVPASL